MYSILRIRDKTNSQELDLRKISSFANVRKVMSRQELTAWRSYQTFVNFLNFFFN
jgi:hypothetical protein